MKTHRSRPSTGFTLVELLVVIAILVVLAALVATGALRAITAARSATNLSQLRDIGIVMKSYATDYGHYPPGWDPEYTAELKGPDKMDWQTSRDHYPDILNAYMNLPAFSDFFLSPVARGTIKNFTGDVQPTNFIGHPAILWHWEDRGAFPDLGEPALSFNKIQRPGEIMLCADGVPSDGTEAKGCETSMRIWAQDGSVEIDDATQRDVALNLDPPGSGSNPSRWIDFRNNGKAHVLFVDGHTEAFAPQDFQVKHVSLGF